MMTINPNLVLLGMIIIIGILCTYGTSYVGNENKKYFVKTYKVSKYRRYRLINFFLDQGIEPSFVEGGFYVLWYKGIEEDIDAIECHLNMPFADEYYEEKFDDLD